MVSDKESSIIVYVTLEDTTMPICMEMSEICVCVENDSIVMVLCAFHQE